MYKLIKSKFTGQVAGAAKIEDDKIISFLFDPDNTDYQRYLVWLSEGNIPEPADEGS